MDGIPLIAFAGRMLGIAVLALSPRSGLTFSFGGCCTGGAAAFCPPMEKIRG